VNAAYYAPLRLERHYATSTPKGGCAGTRAGGRRHRQKSRVRAPRACEAVAHRRPPPV